MFSSSPLVDYSRSSHHTNPMSVVRGEPTNKYMQGYGVALAISSLVCVGLSIYQWISSAYAIVGMVSAITLAITSLLCLVASCLILCTLLPKSSSFQTFLDSQEPVIYANICGDSLSMTTQKAIEHAKESVF